MSLIFPKEYLPLLRNYMEISDSEVAIVKDQFRQLFAEVIGMKLETDFKIGFGYFGGDVIENDPSMHQLQYDLLSFDETLKNLFRRKIRSAFFSSSGRRSDRNCIKKTL